MSKEPTFWSALAQHWEMARRLRRLRLHFDPARCTGAGECYEVCPVGCWRVDGERRMALLAHPERCVACGACVLQCPRRAIELRG